MNAPMATNETKALILEPFAGQSPTLAEFSHDLMQKLFERIVKNEKKVLADRDPEFLHQMRVVCRRLLAALQLLEKVIKIPKAVKVYIASLAKKLGKLRDLDVQIAAIAEKYYPQIGAWEQKKLSKLQDTLKKQRSRIFAEVAATLNHSDYDQFKRRYQNWLEDPQYRPIAHHQLLLVLPELLSPGLSALLLHPGWWATLTVNAREADPQVHALRKVCKTVRYSAEFFTPFYGDGFQVWIGDLKHIQDVLGAAQDGRVLRKLLADQLGEGSNLPELELVMHRDRQENSARWEALKDNYLNLDFRLRLHQMVIKPCWPALQARSAE
jgi:CHAD domain-containing protein